MFQISDFHIHTTPAIAAQIQVLSVDHQHPQTTMSTPHPDAVPCPDVGEGWLIQTVPRKTGNHIDRYWYSPCGRRFRSRPEVDRFLAKKKSRDSKNNTFKHALGKKIYKRFPTNYGSREFGGEIVSYDTKRKLYKIVYEDGDDEEMSDGEIDHLLSKKKSQKKSSKLGELVYF